MYKYAAQLYIANGPAVAESAVVEDDVQSEVAEKTGNEKHRSHTAGKGAMYYKSILPCQRDCNIRMMVGQVDSMGPKWRGR